MPFYVPSQEARQLALFVVHVESQVEKKAQMLREIGTSPLLRALQVHWIGVDATQRDVAHEYISGRLTTSAMNSIMHVRPVGGEYMTQGALGCALSHAIVWNRCVAMQVDACIVFENDVQLDSNFDWAFQFDMAALPNDWDIWYLSSMVSTEKQKLASKALPSSLFQMQGETWGTFGYVIRPRAAYHLSHRVWPLTRQIDSEMMSIYQSDGMQVLRSMTNLVTTSSEWGRASLTQMYQSKGTLMPSHLHVVTSTSGDKQSQEGAARVQRFARAWGASVVYTWGTTTLPFPEEIASLLSGSDTQDDCAIACLALLEISGGTCITDDHVEAVPAQKSMYLRKNELFFIKSWSDRILPHIFGARVAHPLVHRMLVNLTRGASVSNMLNTVPKQLTRGILLVPPTVFTPLPLADATGYNNDAVAAFTQDSVYAQLRLGIPRRLHFVHLGTGISKMHDRCLRSWMKHHPRWRLRLWLDSDISALKVAPLVRHCRSMAQKSDIMRLEILHKYGGVYADTDIESFKNIDPLISGASGILTHEEEVDRLDNEKITNALFGNVAGHPILSRAINLLWRLPRLNTRWIQLETGPAFLSKKVVRTDIDKFRVLPSSSFHPIPYSNRKEFVKHDCYAHSCQHLFPKSYGMHLLSQDPTWYAPVKQTSNADAERLSNLVADIHNHNKWAEDR